VGPFNGFGEQAWLADELLLSVQEGKWGIRQLKARTGSRAIPVCTVTCLAMRPLEGSEGGLPRRMVA
jgi:hypothetical protein